MVIAVVDSGIGGLNVLKALSDKYPNERYIYYSDNRYAPYGIRNTDYLADRLYEISLSAIAEGAEEIVVGCNTMGIGAAPRIASDCAVPMVWIYPDASPETEKSLVMCTPLAARSDRVLTLKKRGAAVYADPRLATMAERAGGTDAAIEKYLEEKLKIFVGCDAVTLGCTHYIFFKEAVREITRARVVRDGVSEVVSRAAKHFTDEEKGGLEFIFSGRDESEFYRRVFRNIAR